MSYPPEISYIGQDFECPKCEDSVYMEGSDGFVTCGVCGTDFHLTVEKDYDGESVSGTDVLTEVKVDV